MTSVELETHKAKVKKVMIDHLTELGYPELSNEQIMGELKNMWVKIEEAGLVVDGMNFSEFAGHAQNQFILSQIQDMFGI